MFRVHSRLAILLFVYPVLCNKYYRIKCPTLVTILFACIRIKPTPVQFWHQKWSRPMGPISMRVQFWRDSGVTSELDPHWDSWLTWFWCQNWTGVTSELDTRRDWTHGSISDVKIEPGWVQFWYMQPKSPAVSDKQAIPSQSALCIRWSQDHICTLLSLYSAIAYSPKVVDIATASTVLGQGTRCTLGA